MMQSSMVSKYDNNNNNNNCYYTELRVISRIIIILAVLKIVCKLSRCRHAHYCNSFIGDCTE